MKTGTHNLDRNPFGHMTIVKIEGDVMTIRQLTRDGQTAVTLSASQVGLLTDILA